MINKIVSKQFRNLNLYAQKKQNLYRACEFSTNGSILSCSKWFDDNLLQQGQNEGLDEKNI